MNLEANRFVQKVTLRGTNFGKFGFLVIKNIDETDQDMKD